MKNLVNFVYTKQNIEINKHKDSYLTQLQQSESLITFVLNDNEIKNLTPELIKCSQEYILICALNNKSYLSYLYEAYIKLRKLIPFLAPPDSLMFISPQKLAKMIPNCYQIISAHYFLFIPTTNVKLAQQIEFIGQRWFARFANCYILLYKKNNS
jgi:hypothetical protein